MPYDGKLLAKARDRLDDIRAHNQELRQRRLLEVYTRLPEVQQLDRSMRAQMAQLVKLTVSRPADMSERIAALRDENLSAQMRRAELLVGAGYPVEYLDDIYSCERCRDTGVYEGQPCACLEKLYNAELTRELGALLRHGDESFDKFDLTLYPDSASDTAGGASPRVAMETVYLACRKFADNFPNVSSDLILRGRPGLGKTYLSACIARVVAGKGYSVCYDTSASALDAFEKQKFSRDTQEGEDAAARVRRMLSCDLMILDDLGTEIVTSMSTSALYTLINSRLVAGKRMIISTNCTFEELRRRYSEQIYSRILGEFLPLTFVGNDIRLIRKGV